MDLVSRAFIAEKAFFHEPHEHGKGDGHDEVGMATPL
jgi:hypothetical protein